MNQSIYDIADVFDDHATCKVCGVSKSKKGIFTHYFRIHTDVGRAHTEAVKDTLANFVRVNKGKQECETCHAMISTRHMRLHQKRCNKQKELTSAVVGQACELCGKVMTSRYGSGRFCGVFCARSAASQVNKAEKNKSISRGLARHGLTKRVRARSTSAIMHNLTCKTCQSQFESRKADKEYCTRLCKSRSPDSRAKMAAATHRRIEQGDDYPRGIKCSFTHRGHTIRCDSKHEWICLVWLTAQLDVLSIERCDIWLPYTLDGKQRKYNPDFIVKTSHATHIVEAKMDQKPGSSTFTGYVREADAKRKVLEEYCKSNGLTCVWYTQNEDRPAYRRYAKEFKQSQ